MSKYVSNVKAFTILEVLIAIFLWSLLLETAIHGYLTMKRIYNSQEDLVSLNNSMRIASFWLWRYIMQAGSVSYEKIADFKVDKLNLVKDIKQNGIYGYSQGSRFLGPSLARKIASNTDVIEIIKSGYGDHKDSEKVVFFVGKTGRFTDKHREVLSLYILRNDRDLEELVSGIEEMRLRYTIDERMAGYLEADKITAMGLWDKVRKIRIELKIVSNGLIVNKKFYVKLRARS